METNNIHTVPEEWRFKLLKNPTAPFRMFDAEELYEIVMFELTNHWEPPTCRESKTSEHRRKISESLKGRSFPHLRGKRKCGPKSEKHKKAISNSLKNSKLKYTCEHCGITVKNKGLLTRWHGDNCGRI